MFLLVWFSYLCLVIIRERKDLHCRHFKDTTVEKTVVGGKDGLSGTNREQGSVRERIK